jgi:hypothetical protein
MNHYMADVLAYHLKQAVAGLPHHFYTYKDLSSKGERPQLKRPFIALSLPPQIGSAGAKPGYLAEVPVLDRTRVAIYIESPLTVTEGGSRKGGFDQLHLPAVKAVREFIRANRSLEIPAELIAAYKDGTVGMRPDQPPEQAARFADGERQVFFVVLSAFERR